MPQTFREVAYRRNAIGSESVIEETIEHAPQG